jgi:hypothetical protein
MEVAGEEQIVGGISAHKDGDQQSVANTKRLCKLRTFLTFWSR